MGAFADPLKLHGGTCDVVVEMYREGLLVEIRRQAADWRRERSEAVRNSPWWHYTDGAVRALEDLRRHVAPPKLKAQRKSRAKPRNASPPEPGA